MSRLYIVTLLIQLIWKAHHAKCQAGWSTSWNQEKEEQAAAEKAVTKEELQGEWTAPAPEFTATQPQVADWSEGMQVPSVPIQQFTTEDWSAHPSTEDWSAAPTAQAAEWAGTTTEWS